MNRINYRLFLLTFISYCFLVTWAFAEDAVADFPPEQTDIYFRTDSAVIDASYRDQLVLLGRYLAAYPACRIRIEGHTDLRGSREYNLALGERRVSAVKNILLENGVLESQLHAVSFGEEIRLERSASASAMSRDRRVSIFFKR